MRRKSKNPVEVLRKKCVERAKIIAKERDNYTCRYCGKKRPEVQIHGSHIYGEGTYRSMSGDPDNIIALCAVHHVGGYWKNNKEPSWHESPMEMVSWFNKKYPDLRKELLKRSRLHPTTDLQYWQKKWEELSTPAILQ